MLNNEDDFQVPYKQTVLSNGLTVCTIPAPSEDFHTFINVAFNVGSADDPYQGSGLAHFVEHMIFVSAGSVGSHSQLSEKINKIGGDHFNGETDHGTTNYLLNVPSGETLNSIDTILDMVFNLSFDQKQLDDEAQIIIEEFHQQQSELSDMLSTATCRAAFRGTPLAWNAIGEPEVLQRVSADDIKSFHEAHYCPERCVVSVCSTLEHEAIVSYINDHYGGLQSSGHAFNRPKFAFTPGLELVNTQNESLSLIGYCFDIEGYSNQRNSLDERYIELISEILGDNSNCFDRMNNILRGELNLVYSASSQFQGYGNNALLSTYAQASPDNFYAVAKELAGLLEAFSDSITDMELDIAKKRVKGNMNVTGYPMQWAEIIADNISGEGGYGLNIKEAYEAIDNITLKEVKQTAHNIFSKQPAVVVVAQPNILKTLPNIPWINNLKV